MYVPKIPIKEQPKWFNSAICHKIKCLKRQLARNPSTSKRLKVDNLEEWIQLMAKSEFETSLAKLCSHQ